MSLVTNKYPKMQPCCKCSPSLWYASSCRLTVGVTFVQRSTNRRAFNDQQPVTVLSCCDTSTQGRILTKTHDGGHQRPRPKPRAQLQLEHWFCRSGSISLRHIWSPVHPHSQTTLTVDPTFLHVRSIILLSVFFPHNGRESQAHDEC
jgi:hypothetical protein